jgi:hypothetical protein
MLPLDCSLHLRVFRSVKFCPKALSPYSIFDRFIGRELLMKCQKISTHRHPSRSRTLALGKVGCALADQR